MNRCVQWDRQVRLFGLRLVLKPSKMIHEHTDINRIRDDIDELIMDEHAIFTLTAKEQEQRAKRLEIDLIAFARQS